MLLREGRKEGDKVGEIKEEWKRGKERREGRKEEWKRGKERRVE